MESSDRGFDLKKLKNGYGYAVKLNSPNAGAYVFNALNSYYNIGDAAKSLSQSDRHKLFTYHDKVIDWYNKKYL